MAYNKRSTRLGLAQLGSAGGLGIEQNKSGSAQPSQAIGLTGIAPNHAVGSMTLLRGFVVALPGIAPNHATGAIAIALSQGVQIASVVGKQAPGVLTVRGGREALRIFVGGVERTNYLCWQDAASGQSAGAPGMSAPSSLGTTLASGTRGRWTLTFTMFVPTGPGTWGPARGQTVLITDFGRRLFAGCIVSVDIVRLLGTSSAIYFNVTAVDKTSICDHRVVTQATFPAGADVADIFRSIISTFLVGEGISAGSLPASIGTTSSDVLLNYVTVTQALDQVSGLINATWWVDSFGAMQLSLLVNCPACPFALTETSYNWRNLSVSYSMLDFRNVQYVRSNLSTLPGNGTTQGITFTWTVQQAAAAARGLVQGAGILPTNADTVISLTVNGVAKTFYYGDQPETFDTTNPLYGRVWWMFQGSNIVIPPGSATSVPNPPEKPSIGDVIVVEFIPSASSSTGSSITTSAATPFAPVPLPGNSVQPGELFGTCGSGIYENVQQVNDIVLQSDLQAIAAAMLQRYGLPPPQITFETDAPGAAVGQLLSVTIPLSYLPAQHLVITDVRGTCMDSNLLVNNPALAFDGLGSSFRWQITAGPDIGDWVKWYESLILRTEHPNPVFRRELPTWVLGPGGSIASGTALTNPYVVQNSGQLISGYAVAGVAPTNQDLQIDIRSAKLGGASILAAPITIPAGSLAIVNFNAFFLDPAYLFSGDVLSISATYVNIGANPIPAGSLAVGIIIQW